MAAAARVTAIILSSQAAVTALVAIIAAVGYGPRAGWSALVGGGICLITTAFFAIRVFARSGAADARRIARAFYIGETQKLLLTIVLFVAVIKWMNVSYGPLFVAYIAALLVFWLTMPFTVDRS